MKGESKMTEKRNIVKRVESITLETEKKKKKIQNDVEKKFDKKMDDLQRVVDGLDIPPSVLGPMDNINTNEIEHIANVSENIAEYIKSEKE